MNHRPNLAHRALLAAAAMASLISTSFNPFELIRAGIKNKMAVGYTPPTGRGRRRKKSNEDLGRFPKRKLCIAPPLPAW